MMRWRWMTHRVAWTLELKPLASLPALAPKLMFEMLPASLCQFSMSKSKEDDVRGYVEDKVGRKRSDPVWV